jgi:hypothetical protein
MKLNSPSNNRRIEFGVGAETRTEPLTFECLQTTVPLWLVIIAAVRPKKNAQPGEFEQIGDNAKGVFFGLN